MSTKQVYNVGTTVYYSGDDINEGGYGKITDHLDDYLGELQLEITLEDGRVIYNVTLEDFESHKVAGNTQVAEFHLVDTGEEGLIGYSELIGDDNLYSEENTTLQYMMQ
jgi:hypothetical protein